MKLADINTVCFVGAGTMGSFNSLLAAFAGYQAVVFDVSEKSRDHFDAQLREMAMFLAAQGMFEAEGISDAISRISISAELSEAVRNAQLVSESVSENLSVKRQVHRELDALCNPESLITTNTSALLISDIDDVFIHGERFAALHSHLGSLLFDIVGSPRTSKANLQLLEAYVKNLGGLPLTLEKENPGYVLNAMLGPLLSAAMVLVVSEQVSVEDVDRAWMKSQGAAIGPFGLMDLFGLNVVFDSWQNPKKKVAALQNNILSFMTPYIERGELGAKCGKGLYRYPNPEYTQQDFTSVSTELDYPSSVLSGTLIESALQLSKNGVAEREKINGAWCFAMSLENGPFDLYAQMGRERFRKIHNDLVALGLCSSELTL